MGFWENFYSLCEKNGKKPNPVAAELGFSSGAVTSWKRGKIPHADKLYRIADYFDVSVDYLLGIEDKKSPVNIDGLSDNRKKLMEFVETVPEDKAEMILRVMKSILQDN